MNKIYPDNAVIPSVIVSSKLPNNVTSLRLTKLEPKHFQFITNAMQDHYYNLLSLGAALNMR